MKKLILLLVIAAITNVSCDNIYLYRIKYKVFIQTQKGTIDTTAITFTTRKGCERLFIDSSSWDTIIGPVGKNFPAYLCGECVSGREPEIHVCIQVEENFETFLPKRWRGNKGYVRTIYYTGEKLRK